MSLYLLNYQVFDPRQMESKIRFLLQKLLTETLSIHIIFTVFKSLNVWHLHHCALLDYVAAFQSVLRVRIYRYMLPPNTLKKFVLVGTEFARISLNFMVKQETMKLSSCEF